MFVLLYQQLRQYLYCCTSQPGAPICNAVTIIEVECHRLRHISRSLRGRLKRQLGLVVATPPLARRRAYYTCSMRPSATSVCGLKLLVYEGVSY